MILNISVFAGFKFTFPSKWWKKPANSPENNSDNNTAGTICSGVKHNISNTGVKVILYPIPKVESIYSHKNANNAMTIIIPSDNSDLCLSLIYINEIVFLPAGKDLGLSSKHLPYPVPLLLMGSTD